MQLQQAPLHISGLKENMATMSPSLVLRVVLHLLFAFSAVTVITAAGTRSCKPSKCFFAFKCGSSSFDCVDGPDCRFTNHNRVCVADGGNPNCLSTAGKVADCTVKCQDQSACSDFYPPPPPTTAQTAEKKARDCNRDCENEVACTCTDGNPDYTDNCLDEAGPACSAEVARCRDAC